MERGAPHVIAPAVVRLPDGLLGERVDDTTGQRYEFDGSTPAGEVIPAERRAAAPSFDAGLLDGARFASAEPAGLVSVLDFRGSWCTPRRVRTPELQEVHADRWDVGAEDPSLVDPRGEVALAFRGFPANVVPVTILLDAERKVAAVCTGAVRGKDLRSALGSLLQEGAR